MLLTDREGTPIGLDVGGASPHEVNLIENLVSQSQVAPPPQTRLLYDKAADSRALRIRLSEQGIQLIAPYRKRKNGVQIRLSDGERSHFSNRWKVERTFSWLKGYRRLAMRWEYHVHLFKGFWQLACLFTILKKF